MRRPLLSLLVPTLLTSLACTGILGDTGSDSGSGSGTEDDCMWYRDQDGDGFGARARELRSCEKPAGHVKDDTDCDDEDPTVYPGAQEICDEIDNDEDCDGDADEEDDSLIPTTWFADLDGDGFGDPENTQDQCDAPDDFVANSDDCDDTNRRVSPDGEEICDGEGGDEDCDGLIDSDDPTMNQDILPYWYQDDDGDGYGDPESAPKEQCDAPKNYAANDEDCDDGNSAMNPGETEVCGDGLDNNCNGSPDGCGLSGDISLSSADVRVTGASGSALGRKVAAIEDIDKDGLDEFAVSAEISTPGGVYLFQGGATGALRYSDADVQFTGESNGDRFGAGIVSGDFNADGKGDIVISDPDYDYSTSYKYTGRVYVFTSSFSTTESAGSANTIYTNNSGSNDGAGMSLGVGDWNGDTRDDLFIGVKDYVIADYGSISSSSGKDLYGINDFEGTISYGYLPSSGGDVDGDGSDDLVVGYPISSASDNGYVYLYTGEFGGSGLNLDSLVDATIEGTTQTSTIGGSQVINGDANGDGYADILLGASNGRGDVAGSGVAYACYGPLSGTSVATDCDYIFKGSVGSGNFGAAVAYVRDEDGDGADDVMIGATTVTGDASNSGVVYLFHGPFGAGSVSATGADATLLGPSSSAYLGSSLDGTGDYNGDGLADLLIGAYYTSSAAGAAYVVFGGAF